MAKRAWYPKRPYKVSGGIGYHEKSYGLLKSALGEALDYVAHGPIGSHAVVRSASLSDNSIQTPYMSLTRLEGCRVLVKLDKWETIKGKLDG